MKKVKLGFRKSSAWFLAGCCVVSLLILTGCDNTLALAKWLENKSLKNGTISVGAVRVIDYNDPCLTASRQRLINALYAMEANLTDANIMPQSYAMSSHSVRAMVTVALALAKSARESNQGGKSNIQESNDLTDALYAIVKNKNPRPSEIEMVGLRMAAQKFIESEIEDLSLANIYPVDSNYYHRVEISLDCTAWVGGKAKAALVLMDLYPYRADIWCAEEAKGILNKKGDFNDLWKNGLRTLEKEGFEPDFLGSLPPPADTKKKRAVFVWRRTVFVCSDVS